MNKLTKFMLESENSKRTITVGDCISDLIFSLKTLDESSMQEVKKQIGSKMYDRIMTLVSMTVLSTVAACGLDRQGAMEVANEMVDGYLDAASKRPEA